MSRMLMRVIHRLTLQQPAISVISLAASVLGLAGLAVLLPKVGTTLIADPSDNIAVLQALGMLVAALVIVRSTFSDIVNIVESGAKIEAGSAVRSTHYSIVKLLDDRCRDVTIIGQNLKAMLDDRQVMAHLRSILKSNKYVQLKFLLSTPRIMELIDRTASVDFGESVAKLVKFYVDLDPHARARVDMRFHPGATALSALIRDPDSQSRGVVVFTPKWSTDKEPTNRIYCAVWKWKHAEIFNKLVGHVPVIMGSEAFSLHDIAREIETRE